MPYVEAPEQVIPGKPLFYATAFPVSGIANPVLVETHEFRPTKVEGNPEHPASLGSTDVPTQASILGLYDPDRLQTVNFIDEVRSYPSFLVTFIRAARQAAGEERFGHSYPYRNSYIADALFADAGSAACCIRARNGTSGSPSGMAAAWAAQMAFGQFLNPVYKFDQADVVLSIDGNFLANGPGGVRYARDFVSKRVLRGGNTTQSRFYAVETTPTSTGCKADHRQAIKPSEVIGFAAISRRGIVWRKCHGPLSGTKFYSALVKDLQASKGKSIVIAGEDQSPEVHAVVHYINQVLGNNGATVTFTPSLEAKAGRSVGGPAGARTGFALGPGGSAVDSGRQSGIQRSPELNLKGAIQMAKLRIRLGDQLDETSEVCQWNIPMAHPYEHWSDAPAYDGTVSIMQPLIAPLYEGKSAHELIAAFTNNPQKSSYECVRDYWQTKHTGADYETWWKHSVHDGFIKDSAPAGGHRDRETGPGVVTELRRTSGYEISFHSDPYHPRRALFEQRMAAGIGPSDYAPDVGQRGRNESRRRPTNCTSPTKTRSRLTTTATRYGERCGASPASPMVRSR